MCVGLCMFNYIACHLLECSKVGQCKTSTQLVVCDFAMHYYKRHAHTYIHLHMYVLIHVAAMR